MICVGAKNAKLHHGDYGPAQFYKGDVKIAGYNDTEKVGTQISGVDTYNDQLNPTIEGKSEQTVTANSPSPDYPSPIHSSEDFDVVSCGRNLLDVYKWGNKNGVVPIDNVITQTFTSGALFLNGTRAPIKLKPNHTYSIVVSVLKSDTTDINGYAGLWRYDNGFADGGRFLGSFRIVANSVTVQNFTTSPEGNFALGIGDGNGTPYTLSLQVMILEGTYTAETLPPYQPYHATTAHITGPLRSVSNVSDSIEVSGGKVEVVRRVVRYAVTSSSYIYEYYTHHDSYTHFQIESPVGIVKSECLCNILPFRHGSWAVPTECAGCSSYFFYPTFTNVALGISDADTPTQKVSKLKSWLTTHEMYVDVLPDIPARTNITATPLGQALLALRTQPHYTQVSTNAIIPPTLRAKIKELL